MRKQSMKRWSLFLLFTKDVGGQNRVRGFWIPVAVPQLHSSIISQYLGETQCPQLHKRPSKPKHIFELMRHSLKKMIPTWAVCIMKSGLVYDSLAIVILQFFRQETCLPSWGPFYHIFHNVPAMIKIARHGKPFLTNLCWPPQDLRSPALWDWFLSPGRRICWRSSPAFFIASTPTSVSMTTCSVSGSEAYVRLRKRSRGMLQGFGTALRFPPIQGDHQNKTSYPTEINLKTFLVWRNWPIRDWAKASASLWYRSSRCSSAWPEKQPCTKSRITANPY